MTAGDSVDPAVAARELALRLLSAREHSAAELQRKLQQRGFEAPLAVSVIDELAAENLQSDERYADAFVRSRRSRLQGPLKIQAELRQRGVDKALIDRVMAAYSEDWPLLAAEFIVKRNMADLLDDYQARQKVYRRLANRGFSHSEAIAAFREIKST